jgi:hypothetical protein
VSEPANRAVVRLSPRGLGLRGIAIVVALALLVVGWLYASRPRQAPVGASSSVLDVIPEGAFLVATVDMKALRQTEIGRRFLGEGRSVAGLGEVTELCGSDPMETVAELGFAVPAAAGVGFGVFATGTLDAEALMSCAARIVDKRGGTPMRQTHDRFAVLRDASLELSSAELAVAQGGPLLLAEPPYVRAALEVAAGRAPSTRDEPEHRALRELVDPGLLIATVVLDEEQRKSLLDELRAQAMTDSPFSSLTSGAMSVGIDESLRVHAVLRCTSSEACAGVSRLIDAARKDEAGSVVARAVGLAPVLDRVAITAEGEAVHLRARLPVDEALEVVRKALLLRRLSQLQPDEVAPADSVKPPEPPADAGVRIPAPGGSAP